MEDAEWERWSAFGALGVALFVAAFSIVVIRSRVLPTGLGWFGGLVALVLFAASSGSSAS